MTLFSELDHLTDHALPCEAVLKLEHHVRQLIDSAFQAGFGEACNDRDADIYATKRHYMEHLDAQ